MRLGTDQIYYVLDNGQQYGPCSESEIAQCVAGGTFTPAAQVWREGSPVWSALPPQIAAMAPRQAAGSWPAVDPISKPAIRQSRDKSANQNVILIGSIVAVLAIVLIIGAAVPKAQKPFIPETPIDVDAATLMHDWVKTPLAASEKYNMHRVRVSGVIDAVDMNSTDAVVVLHCGFKPRRVVCLAKNAADFRGLKVNQVVTMDGVCTPLDGHNLKILFCVPR